MPTKANPARIREPAPDPGNAPPENWTEPLDPAEVEAITERLRRETEGGD